MGLGDDWLAVPLGVTITLVGAGFAVFHIATVRVTGVTVVDAGHVFLFCAAVGTAFGGVWLLREAPSNGNSLRWAGWWVGAMALTLFMATILVHNQSRQSVRVARPVVVVINSLTVGSGGGCLVGYLRVRERERAAALSDQRDRLRRERERLEVLHRMVRHDIRNDMSVALGWSRELYADANEQQTHILDRVHAAGEHVVELTELSRDYVAAVVDEDAMALEPVDLGRVLRMEVETRRDAYPDASFALDTDLPSVRVPANELLFSVFRNVLNNAVQHHDGDHPAVTVSVTASSEDVRIEIADDGPGVPNDQKEAVFGKGELGVESEGTGIGLFLVHVLVSEYGGRVHLADNDPRGTVVVVELPRADTPGRDGARVTPSQHPALS